MKMYYIYESAFNSLTEDKLFLVYFRPYHVVRIMIQSWTKTQLFVQFHELLHQQNWDLLLFVALNLQNVVNDLVERKSTKCSFQCFFHQNVANQESNKKLPTTFFFIIIFLYNLLMIVFMKSTPSLLVGVLQ